MKSYLENLKRLGITSKLAQYDQKGMPVFYLIYYEGSRIGVYDPKANPPLILEKITMDKSRRESIISASGILRRNRIEASFPKEICKTEKLVAICNQ